MFANKSSLLAVAALGLALGAPAMAAEGHDHDHEHAAGSVQLRLDHGKKWELDAVAHRGMGEIRDAMAQALPAIHKKTFTPAQYEALAARIQTQVTDMIANCKLPEATDAQFHLVIGPIAAGASEMKTPASAEQGAVKVVRALADYGKYFHHAGWRALKH